MTGKLEGWKAGTLPGLLWIDFDRYAWRVFAGAPDDWYRDPVRFAAMTLQAHGVVGSDIVSFDICAPFLDALTGDPSTAAAVDGLEPAAAVQTLLEAEAPRRFVREVLDALAHRLAGKADLALKLRSPRDLLLACGAPADAEPDFGDLDDVAVALANFVRGYAERPVQVLQVAASDARGISPDEAEALDPLLRAADYYGWGAAVSLDGAADADPPDLAADLLLVGGHLTAGGGRLPVGGGLDAAFWRGQAEPTDWAVCYGVIPDDVTPEAVIARLDGLRREA